MILQEECDDAILSTTIWSLGQIGCHSYEHAKAIAVVDGLQRYQTSQFVNQVILTYQIFLNPQKYFILFNQGYSDLLMT